MCRPLCIDFSLDTLQCLDSTHVLIIMRTSLRPRCNRWTDILRYIPYNELLKKHSRTWESLTQINLELKNPKSFYTHQQDQVIKYNMWRSSSKNFEVFISSTLTAKKKPVGQEKDPTIERRKYRQATSLCVLYCVHVITFDLHGPIDVSCSLRYRRYVMICVVVALLYI